MKMFHGSPLKGLKKISFNKTNQRFDSPIEGDGIYLTSSEDVARDYAAKGSVYEINLAGNLLDARSRKHFDEMISKLELEFNIKLANNSLINDTIDCIILGDYGVTTFARQMSLVLDSDEVLYEYAADVELFLDKEISSFDGFIYIDQGIDAGNSFVALMRNEEVIEIVKEI